MTVCSCCVGTSVYHLFLHIFFCSMKTPYRNEVTINLNIVWLQEAEEQFEVEISSDSVIHLVENLDTNSDTSSQHVAQNGEPLCVANIETVTEVPLICFIKSVLNVLNCSVICTSDHYV